MRNGFRDERREIHSTHSLQGKLAVFMVALFAIGFSVLAWDLSMGLSLHFQSTLYSWWFFMGGWLCALMVFSILVRAWNAHLNGAGGVITETHFHDIGKLCFAFTAFWGYLTFGQYLVIWYGNLGDDVLHAPATHLTVEVGDGRIGGDGVLRAVLRSALARGESESLGDDTVRARRASPECG